ncbi:MAG: DUF6732 family protein [Oricola sp.]
MTFALRLPALAPLLLVAEPAHAHFGHVGELASHSHWIGVAAAAGAAAIAAAMTVRGKKKDAEAKPDDAQAEDAPQGDDAPAKA